MFLPITIVGTFGTVVGMKLCVRRPLELRGKVTSGVGGVADKEAYTIQTLNIISNREHFEARHLR